MSKPAAIIYVPVKPHIRQFLLQELGNDPFHIDQRTYIGKLVLMALEKSPYRLTRAEKPLDADKRFGLVLPKALKHYTISEEKRRQLGEILEKYFQEVLVTYMKGQVGVTQNELGALKHFFRIYDLNPDQYDLEAGRKQWRDYKDRILRVNGQYLNLYELDPAAAVPALCASLRTTPATALC